MNAIKCDTCDKVSALEGLMGWYKLEDIGVSSGYGDHEWHFCSWHCVSEYAQDKLQVR